MKNLNTFIILFLFGVTTGQAQNYKDSFKSDICDCLTQEKLKRRLTENTYNTCYKQTLPNYAAQIDAQIVEEDVSQKFYKGQLARKELLQSFKYELVYSCDTYYEFLEGLRVSRRLIAAEQVKEGDLESYNQQVALTPNAVTYFMRAQLQFKLGNLKEAESDIDKSIEVNPNKENVKSLRSELLLLGWIYEEQNRFNDAITVYDKIYLGDYDTEILILRALADRKSGGTAPLKPGTSDANIQVKKDKASSRRTRADSKKSTKGSASVKTRGSNTVTKKKDTASLRKLFKMDD